ncbi:chalcone isomerase family protein [Rheinheimera sp.]|uniref:chalcone isomerase family protein n=1 Tax=Rheinheimera sp. TaxID=1869214 RepID=UPI00307FC3DD
MSKMLSVLVKGLTTLLLLTLVGQAVAEQARDTTGKTGLKLVGQAQFSVLFWDLYQSWLYSPSGRFTGVEPGVLFEIRYLRDISKDQLIENTVKQWQHLKVSPAQYQDYLPQLQQVWPDIRKGDVLTLKVEAGHTEFYFNQQPAGVIASPDFAALFLDIWLSPQTSEPKLRQQLLGAQDASE